MRKKEKKKEEGKGVKREKRLLASGGWQASNDTNHRVFASTAAAVAHYRLSVPPAVRLSEAPILAVTTVRLVILLRHPIADWSWPHLHRTHTSSSSLSLPSTPLLLPPSSFAGPEKESSVAIDLNPLLFSKERILLTRLSVSSSPFFFFFFLSWKG